MADYDYLIKFLALGDSGVGKTSFLVFLEILCSENFFCSFKAQIYRQFIHGSIHINRWDRF